MKRDELVDFTDEQKDLVMSLYGKAISKKDTEIETLKNSNKELEGKIVNFESQIDGLNKTIEDNNKSLENLQTITNEKNDLMAELQLNKSHVKDEFSKFVKSEVLAKVNDTTDFASALESYKKDSPQFFGDTVVKKVQSSPTLNNGGNKAITTNDIMNNILRGARK